MKFSKKVLPMVLAMAMVPTMSMTAFAAQTPTTVNGSAVDISKHTFAAYQIFEGDYSEGKLSNVKWGSGVKADESGKKGFNYGGSDDAAVIAQELTKAGADANDFAKVAAQNLASAATATGTGTVTLAKAGYYLIVDTTDIAAGGYDAKNLTLLKVTGDNQIITPNVKTDKPSVEKKVAENTKYPKDAGYGETFNDVADYNIGDSVDFHLIGAVPDMKNYDTYKYEFEDTLSNGLTVPALADIKVYLSDDKKVDQNDDSELTNDSNLEDNLTVSVSGQKIYVSFKDLKTIENIAKGKYIIVEYSARLNADAVIGLDGNENKVKLKFSNNPNGNGTGETPEDKVIVFTYELDTTKIDADNQKKLSGAEFKLINKAGKFATVDSDGKVTGWVDTEADGSTLVSDNDGLFRVIGLDAGDYKLKETKAPGGYNLISKPIDFTITATTNNDQKWNGQPESALTNLEITVNNKTTSGNTSTGIVNMNVENKSGSTLPETGGIGTTIFYVVGVILMLGAGVLLVTKKRMSSNR